MILEKIRTVFPESTRTLEQDLIIGSPCLALIPRERNAIENVNFSRYESGLKEEKRKVLSIRKKETVDDAQWWGEVSGCTCGGITTGVVAWYLTVFSPLATLISGIGGGILGAKIGKNIGENIGYERVVKDVTNSPEYVHWKNKKYETIILPALSRYVYPGEERKIYSNVIKPVRVEQEKEKRLISPQETQELVHSFSTNGRLEELPEVYEETVKLLTCKYNLEVFKQRIIVNQTKIKQPVPESITKVISQEEINKIVKLYSMTQEKRNDIVIGMQVELSKSLSLEDAKASFEFLNAAAKLPELIKQNID